MRILASLACVLVLGQQQSAQQPTFRTDVNFVEVDVVVTDRSGRPVRGLQQQDFQVFEDGKPVTVSTFVAVDLPQAAAAAVIAPADRSGIAIGSNDQPEDGRVMLIVLDDHHVRFDAGYAVRSKAIARRLVERLGPSDQAAVVATSGRSGVRAEFTGDKARLIEAIDRFFPQSERGPGPFSAAARGGPPDSMGFVGEIKARWAMDTLSNAARALAEIPHRRKAILLVSEGLPVSVEDVISNQYAESAWRSFRDFIVTAQRSNIAVYPVDPCGLSGECSTPAQENLRALAENTGGFAVVNTNAPEESVERIVAENGTYYLLGYPSPAPPFDGRRHRIRVRVRDANLQVRAREGYVAPRRPGKSSAAPPLDALIGAPIQTRGLTMRMAAVPAPLGSAPGSTIVVGLELPAKQAVEAVSIDFSLVAVDSEGRVRARQRFANTFEARAAAPAGWVRLRSHLAVAPGRYQIRAAAIGANRVQGSVFAEVIVPKIEGDLFVGGLSLATPAPGAAADAKHMEAAPALSPLATRDVPAGAEVSAQVPIRAAGAASQPLTIATTLAGPQGPAVILDQGPRAASEYAKGAGQIYRVALPRDLAPGSYRLTVDVALGRARVTREIAVIVQGPGRTQAP